MRLIFKMSTQPPQSYSLPLYPGSIHWGNAHWTQPANLYWDDLCNSLRMKSCKEVTGSGGQRGDPFQKTMMTDWSALGDVLESLSQVVLTYRNIWLTVISKLVYFLSHGPAHLGKPSSEATQKPYYFGLPWVCQSLLAARVWSSVDPKAGRQSFCCQSSWVYRAPVFSKMSDSSSCLENMMLNF